MSKLIPILVLATAVGGYLVYSNSTSPTPYSQSGGRRRRTVSKRKSNRKTRRH